ncbi:MAG: hypothetical protein OCC49_06420 [Fibrobacterales bacterium]
MNQNALYFIGDTQWGTQLETPHHVGNALLLRHPDVDIQLSYNNSIQNTIKHLNAHDAKDIIGKRTTHIILSVGWGDINILTDSAIDTVPFSLLIQHITSFSGIELYLCNQAVESYPSFDKKKNAEKVNALFEQYTLKNLHIIDYDRAFNAFHESEAHYKRAPHSLHFSNGQLTQLGSHLLAEALLIKIEKNATFTSTLKD